jgi:hypothetical protein
LNLAVPRSFRGEESSGYPEPGTLQEYRSRSMVEEYRVLAIVFGVLFLALTAYFIKSVLGARTPTAPTQSVYVEVVPQNAAPVPAPAKIP